MRLLPPWSRAPLLGLRQPTAVLAVLVTTAILACVVASAPLFLSSARSAALEEQLAPHCAEAAWPAGADQSVERWTHGDVAVAGQALRDAGAIRVTDTVPADVQRTANLLGITGTFGYLAALAVSVGVIGAAGLLLYLEARARSRVSGSVMARRMGLTRTAHLRSTLVELGGVLAAGAVLRG